MKVHFCPLSPECRRWGALWRLTIFTKKRIYQVAFRPRDKFARVSQSPNWPFDRTLTHHRSTWTDVRKRVNGNGGNT